MDERMLSQLITLITELEQQLELLAKTVALQNQTIEAALASEVLVMQLLLRRLEIDPETLTPELLRLAEETVNPRLREQLELHVLALRKMAAPAPEEPAPEGRGKRPRWCRGVIDGGKGRR